ncbi:MAG: hypothetical protein AAF602_09545 [Myxococcota bacterium]
MSISEAVAARARELGALAVGLCQDAGIGLEVAPGGWSWDPVRRVIRVSAEGLASQGPEYCAGIVAHEVGHYHISRYNRFPLEVVSVRAARNLLNAIEDPRVDRWITSRYPGARPWQNQALVDEILHEPGTPRFLMFCLECAAEGDRDWQPSTQELPPSVVDALAATRDARHRYALHFPPTNLDEPVTDEIIAAYREEVWPALPDLRWMPSRREQRVQHSAYTAFRLAEEEIFPVGLALYVEDRRKIARWLMAHPDHAAKGRRVLEDGRPGAIVAEALQADLPAKAPHRWADELAQQLLDGALDQRVNAPVIALPGSPREFPARPWDADAVDLPPLPRVWQPASNYDLAYAEVADQVEQLVQHLDEVIRPQQRLRQRAGYPTGRRVDLRRLMTFESDPRRYDELWVRTSIPDRRNAAIGLLVDLSGSMQGQKAQSALKGSILVAETLHRLQVTFGVYGFQDVLIKLHDFGSPLTPAARNRLAEMTQEVAGSRAGGNNEPGYNDDGPCLLEFAAALQEVPAVDRILIVVSDGLPEGRRSSRQDLHNAVAQLSDDPSLRLIALGLGAGTGHVRNFYPESTADVPLAQFAETIGNLVEGVLIGEG